MKNQKETPVTPESLQVAFEHAVDVAKGDDPKLAAEAQATLEEIRNALNNYY